jgi:multimeric flavodoxin WrbA
MKVVAVLGSPRRGGNSDTVVKWLSETAEQLGAEVRTFALNELAYRGCQACMGCKTTSEKCVLEDDLTRILDAVSEADILLMATPIYYYDVSSQLKTFIDRTFSYLVPDFLMNPDRSRLSPGKTFVLVLTQGYDENCQTDVFPRYARAFNELGFGSGHLIRACGLVGAGRTAALEEAAELAEETARNLLK